MIRAFHASIPMLCLALSVYVCIAAVNAPFPHTSYAPPCMEDVR